MSVLVHNICFNDFLNGLFHVFSFTSPKTQPTLCSQLCHVKVEVKYGKSDQILPLLLCDRILLSPWQVLGKHHRDFSMREVTFTLHLTLGEDYWVPGGWIFRCNLWNKRRNQPQLSLSFEGLKCLFQHWSTDTTPTAEVSETLWRTVTALFEYPILSTGKRDLHLWPHLLLDSMAFFAWIHIFKELKYLINTLLVEARENLKLDISWGEMFHGKFQNILAGSESKRNPNFETSAFPTTGNTRLHLASVLNTPHAEGSKVTQNCKTTTGAENSLQQLSAHSAIAQTFSEV